jgi:hypothetical protein
MAFNIKIPYVVATHVKKFAALSSLKNKSKAAAFGLVGGKFAGHNGTNTVNLMDDATGIPSARTIKYATLALTGAAVHAAAVGIVNPEAVDVLVTGIYLDLTTHATAASGSIDVGWSSVSITTASDTLADGLLVGSGVTVPVLYTGNNQGGANGKFVTHWTNGTWITVSDDATADVTGMVATLYIAYILK